MAGLATPRKSFRYLLELDGADSFLIQEIDPPKVELAVVEHASPGNIPNAKTPGKMKVGELVVKKMKPANRVDTWAWELMAAAALGLTPTFVKTGFLKELAPDMVTTVSKFFLGDCWVSAIEHSGYKGTADENIIETVTFAVQFYFPTDSPQFNSLFGGTASGAGGASSAGGLS